MIASVWNDGRGIWCYWSGGRDNNRHDNTRRIEMIIQADIVNLHICRQGQSTDIWWIYIYTEEIMNFVQKNYRDDESATSMMVKKVLFFDLLSFSCYGIIKLDGSNTKTKADRKEVVSLFKANRKWKEACLNWSHGRSPSYVWINLNLST